MNQTTMRFFKEGNSECLPTENHVQVKQLQPTKEKKNMRQTHHGRVLSRLADGGVENFAPLMKKKLVREINSMQHCFSVINSMQ